MKNYKHADVDKCEEFRLNPDAVEDIAVRLKKVADDAQELGVLIYAGTSDGLSLRFETGDMWFADATTIVAQDISYNCDGGDGGD